MHDTIAIDFGTMRTKMAYIDPNRNTVELMRIGQDDRPYILSEFFLGRDGIRLFGDDAVEHLDSDPLAFLPRPLKRELRGEWVRAGNRQKATPIELLSLMFQGLRNRTKELPHFRDIPPTGLSLTIPAQYGAKDKEILARAAINAGFSEEKIAFISEPIAAAQAWLRELGGQEEYVTVLDCGGGTLDWACLRRLADNTFELIAEIPAGGDIQIGGFDIDEAICATLDDDIDDENIRNELKAKQCLIKDQARKIKEKYSRTGKGGKIYVGLRPFEFSPDRLEDIINRRFTSQACQNFKTYVDNVRANTQQDKPTVLLVGGSAQLRGFQQTITEQCKCNAIWWERSEFATVLGALLPDVKQSQVNKSQVSVAIQVNPKELKKEENKDTAINDSLARSQHEDALKCLREGNIEEAIQKLSLCVILSPSFSAAKELLVNTYVSKKDLQAAMIAAKSWTDTEPDNLRAWITFGCVAFNNGDYATSTLILGRNDLPLRTEELLLLSAGLFRQGKSIEARGVLLRLNSAESDHLTMTLQRFLLAWLNRGTDYKEEDLNNFVEAFNGFNNFKKDETGRFTMSLNQFGIALSDVLLSTQIEMFRALLTLNSGNLRLSMTELYDKCNGLIHSNLVGTSLNPNLVGKILSSILCTKGKMELAAALIAEMCLNDKKLDIRLIQNDKIMRSLYQHDPFKQFFEPNLLISENHGAVFNDVTVTNQSFYGVTRVEVQVTVVRQGNREDKPFTVLFPYIESFATEKKENVFKNAGWFGGDIVTVDCVVIGCDQTVLSRKLKEPHTNDYEQPVKWENLFSENCSKLEPLCGNCPKGHGPLKMWEGKPRCWKCGYPER